VILGRSCQCTGRLAHECRMESIDSPTFVTNPPIRFSDDHQPPETLLLSLQNATLTEVPYHTGECPDGYTICAHPNYGSRCLAPIEPSECPPGLISANDLVACHMARPGQLCKAVAACSQLPRQIHVTCPPSLAPLLACSAMACPCTCGMNACSCLVVDARSSVLLARTVVLGSMSYAPSPHSRVVYACYPSYEHSALCLWARYTTMSWFGAAPTTEWVLCLLMRSR
jgi:hypothetical protein